jgi:HK97 family phage major capsid protein
VSIVKDNIKRLMDERAAAWKRDGQPIAEAAETRALTPEESTKFKEARDTFEAFSSRIKTLEGVAEQDERLAEYSDIFGTPTDQSETWRNLSTGERAALRRGESIASHPAYERASSVNNGDIALANYGTLGALIRSLATGGTGSALVPTLWAGELIDLAREASSIGRAGATIVPMDAGTIQIGRKTGNPTAAFRAENTGPTPSDPTFDSVTLTARTMEAIVVGSIEFFQDAPNADQLVMQALAEAMADKLDLVALYGGITTGSGSINLPTGPNPRGVLAALTATRPANVLGASATNGTSPTVAAGYWNEVLDAVFTVVDGNETPNALLRSGKLARQYAKAVDTTGQPLRTPDALASIQQLTVNSIPNYTKGSLTTATDLFVGDWSQLLVGQRLGVELKPLPELYRGTGQVGVLATWRGDIQLARSSAFSVYRSLAGAA